VKELQERCAPAVQFGVVCSFRVSKPIHKETHPYKGRGCQAVLTDGDVVVTGSTLLFLNIDSCFPSRRKEVIDKRQAPDVSLVSIPVSKWVMFAAGFYLLAMAYDRVRPYKPARLALARSTRNYNWSFLSPPFYRGGRTRQADKGVPRKEFLSTAETTG
jgi:hypothetical protein